MIFTTPLPFKEALEKFQERKIVPTGLSSAELALLPVELRERAFFSARVESARLLQSMRDYTEDYLAVNRLENGGLAAQGRAQFVADMRELAIREGLGKIDPATGRINPLIVESDLTDIRSIARLELIFDTQVEAAQEYGYFAQGQDEAILDVFPAQRFIRVRPVEAPRDYHAANEGVVKRKDDVKFWLSMNRDFGVPWGPWGFNSGMGVEDVDREEAISLGVMKEKDVVKPVKRKFNEGLEASTRGLDGGILAALARETGGEISNSKIQVSKEEEMPLPQAATSSSVSEKMIYHSRATKAQKQRHDEILSIIDGVHGDGPLEEMPIRWSQSDGGHYAPGKEIKIGKTALWRSQAVHEIGHKLDREGIGAKSSYASVAVIIPEMKEVMTAIKGSTAYQNLQEGSQYASDRKYRKYQLEEVELWARAYTQYIAEESGDKDLLDDIAQRRSGKVGYWADSQWEEADFAPIRDKIHGLFHRLGWNKP